jgi:formamidopyrimidine-DNA glycosylase
MPEGHLLHRLARDQAELAGHVLGVTSPQGRFAAGRMVYKQAACRACGTPVETWDLAGRVAYACPRCQPR